MDYFCKECGTKLVATPSNKLNWLKHPNGYPKFDDKTGKPIDYSGLKYECPKNRFWNLHDSFFLEIGSL